MTFPLCPCLLNQAQSRHGFLKCQYLKLVSYIFRTLLVWGYNDMTRIWKVLCNDIIWRWSKLGARVRYVLHLANQMISCWLHFTILVSYHILTASLRGVIMTWKPFLQFHESQQVCMHITIRWITNSSTRLHKYTRQSLSCFNLQNTFTSQFLVCVGLRWPLTTKGQWRGTQNRMQWLAVQFLDMKSSLYFTRKISRVATRFLYSITTIKSN